MRLVKRLISNIKHLSLSHICIIFGHTYCVLYTLINRSTVKGFGEIYQRHNKQSEELHRSCRIRVMHRILRLKWKQRNGFENGNAALKSMENLFQMVHSFHAVFTFCWKQIVAFHFKLNILSCSDSWKYQSKYLIFHNVQFYQLFPNNRLKGIQSNGHKAGYSGLTSSEEN